MVLLFLAASAVSIGVLNLVGLWLVWQRLATLENLINELGTMTGEWIDSQSDK